MQLKVSFCFIPYISPRTLNQLYEDLEINTELRADVTTCVIETAGIFKDWLTNHTVAYTETGGEKRSSQKPKVKPTGRAVAASSEPGAASSEPGAASSEKN